MKKNFLSMAILAVVVSMSSCGGGSSFEGDVKKFGNMRCKAQQLAAKDQSDEKVKKELDDKDNQTKEQLSKVQAEYEQELLEKEVEIEAKQKKINSLEDELVSKMTNPIV